MTPHALTGRIAHQVLVRVDPEASHDVIEIIAAMPDDAAQSLIRVRRSMSQYWR